jgi:hypothetical protein
MLVGDLLWEETVRPLDALWLAAELAEYLIRHDGFQRDGYRELEPSVLLQTVTGHITAIPGARRIEVQLSAAGTMLAQHTPWQKTILLDLKLQYRKYDAHWQDRLLTLVKRALAWDETESAFDSPTSWRRLRPLRLYRPLRPPDAGSWAWVSDRSAWLFRPDPMGEPAVHIS